MCFVADATSEGDVYLNINMSHEFWPSTPVDLLRSFDKSHNLLLAAWIVGVGTLFNMVAWSGVLLMQFVVEKACGCAPRGRAKQTSKKTR